MLHKCCMHTPPLAPGALALWMCLWGYVPQRWVHCTSRAESTRTKHRTKQHGAIQHPKTPHSTARTPRRHLKLSPLPGKYTRPCWCGPLVRLGGSEKFLAFLCMSDLWSRTSPEPLSPWIVRHTTRHAVRREANGSSTLRDTAS
jgi:hypothetical protein